MLLPTRFKSADCGELSWTKQCQVIELLFTVPHNYNIQVKAAEAPITKIVGAFHQCFEKIPRVEVIVKYRVSSRVLTTGNLLSPIKCDGAEACIVTMPELVERTYIVSLPDKTRVTRGRHDELLGIWLALGEQRKTTGRNEMGLEVYRGGKWVSACDEAGLGGESLEILLYDFRVLERADALEK